MDPASRRRRALVADRAVSGAASADVDARIVLTRERSSAGRCASESLVAFALVGAGRRRATAFASPTHESQGLGGRIRFAVGWFGVVRVTELKRRFWGCSLPRCCAA